VVENAGAVLLNKQKTSGVTVPQSNPNFPILRIARFAGSMEERASSNECSALWKTNILSGINFDARRLFSSCSGADSFVRQFDLHLRAVFFVNPAPPETSFSS